MFSSSLVCLLLAAVSVIVAQFVPPPTDFINSTGYLAIPVRYKEIPTGICELDPNVKSYSGHVDVAENQQ
jgi:carboxypeptidase D